MRAQSAETLWATLALGALFAAVFVRVLVSYLHRRDALQRDVVLMFSALAVLPILFLAQIAFIVSFGVLLDTLVVRSLLVPAVLCAYAL